MSQKKENTCIKQLEQYWTYAPVKKKQENITKGNNSIIMRQSYCFCTVLLHYEIYSLQQLEQFGLMFQKRKYRQTKWQLFAFPSESMKINALNEIKHVHVSEADYIQIIHLYLIKKFTSYFKTTHINLFSNIIRNTLFKPVLLFSSCHYIFSITTLDQLCQSAHTLQNLQTAGYQVVHWILHSLTC